MRLDDRVALVTGANKGLGRRIALAMAEEGARVVVTGRSAARNDEVAREIVSRGGKAMAVRLDVTELSSIEQVVDSVLSKWARSTSWSTTPPSRCLCSGSSITTPLSGTG